MNGLILNLVLTVILLACSPLLYKYGKARNHRKQMERRSREARALLTNSEDDLRELDKVARPLSDEIRRQEENMERTSSYISIIGKEAEQHYSFSSSAEAVILEVHLDALDKSYTDSLVYWCALIWKLDVEISKMERIIEKLANFKFSEIECRNLEDAGYVVARLRRNVETWRALHNTMGLKPRLPQLETEGNLPEKLRLKRVNRNEFRKRLQKDAEAFQTARMRDDKFVFELADRYVLRNARYA